MRFLPHSQYKFELVMYLNALINMNLPHEGIIQTLSKCCHILKVDITKKLVFFAIMSQINEQLLATKPVSRERSSIKFGLQRPLMKVLKLQCSQNRKQIYISIRIITFYGHETEFVSKHSLLYHNIAHYVCVCLSVCPMSIHVSVTFFVLLDIVGLHFWSCIFQITGMTRKVKETCINIVISLKINQNTF